MTVSFVAVTRNAWNYIFGTIQIKWVTRSIERFSVSSPTWQYCQIKSPLFDNWNVIYYTHYMENYNDTRTIIKIILRHCNNYNNTVITSKWNRAQYYYYTNYLVNYVWRWSVLYYFSTIVVSKRLAFRMVKRKCIDLCEEKKKKGRKNESTSRY